MMGGCQKESRRCVAAWKRPLDPRQINIRAVVLETTPKSPQGFSIIKATKLPPL
jgi:hypothetical protein